MALTPLRVTALRHSAFYSPLLFAEKEGLQPHYAPSTPEKPAVQQLQSGEAHVSQLAVAASFASLEKAEKQDLVHFANINERDGFFLVGRKKSFDWKDLENKEVLVDHLFQPLALIKYACHLKKVDYSSIKVVDAGGPDAMEAAFREGRGDFVHLQGPAAQQLEHDGVGAVAASCGEAIGPVAFSSLCAQRSWLQTDMAKAFLRAYGKSRALVAEITPEEVAEVVQVCFPEIQRAVLVETIATYQRMGCWQGTEAISTQSYETLLDAFMYAGVITKRHPYDAAIALME
ncbi:unnamed protein product [Effrenium voratum]|uniref:SsuA/THI5-like domain-containing protein n=1 Tax=Effrenium voratum TaxID=2562239 RepID=A0AA36N8F9_9DINO|nr:unnamed protein product [Effrenium voratum]